MTDIPASILSKAREIYEGSWPDPVLAIAEALFEASNTPPAQKAGDSGLKPCPFCGATDSEENATQQAGIYLVSFRSPIGKPAHRVECQCGSSGSAHIGPMSAMALWNRRADDPQSMNPEALAAHIAELQLVLNGKREIESL